MAEKGKYLYCVIKEKEKPKNSTILEQVIYLTKKMGWPKRKNIKNINLITGQEGEKIYTINKEGVKIVVSDTSKEEYSFIKEYLTTHQKVIEEVMKEGYDVLPVRFGTVAKNKTEEDIREKILSAKRKELLETFSIVEGRVELGLRALWKDMLAIFQESERENSEIQNAKAKTRKNPHRMAVAGVGEMVQKALDAKRKQESQKILSPLKKLAVDFKERELLRSPEPLRDSMILSSAFLVPKKNCKEFEKRVEALIKEYDQRIKFIYTGMIPPFNFVELNLHI